MIALKTDLKHNYDRKLCLPIVGEVFISKEGTFDIEDEEAARKLVALGIGFFVKGSGKLEDGGLGIDGFVKRNILSPDSNELSGKSEDGALAPKVEDDELNKSKVEGFNEKEVTQLLEAKTLAELKEMAQAFPMAEWRTLNKANLIEYLRTKL